MLFLYKKKLIKLHTHPSLVFLCTHTTNTRTQPMCQIVLLETAMFLVIMLESTLAI